MRANIIKNTMMEIPTESDPPVLKGEILNRMQARAVFFFSACISRFDEKKNQGGSISCGQPGSFYCGFSNQPPQKQYVS